jgi:D-arabinose 1-dehydrogenase-like Zn-dependent alcohol dehydrogenase
MIQGFGCDGMFAEYTAIDRHNAIHLPESLDMATSAPIFCAGITGMKACMPLNLSLTKTLFTAFHGVDSCDLKPGQWVVIVGCGGLGQFGIKFAKAMGFNVIGIDINDEVLQEAKKTGADVIINSKTSDFKEEVKKVTNGGADAAVVYSAAQAAYDTATKTLKIGGILMVIGLPSQPLSFNVLELMCKLYQIRSESTGPPHQMPRALEFITKHNIKPEVAQYKLDDINEMIELMQTGKSKSRMAVVF